MSNHLNVSVGEYTFTMDTGVGLRILRHGKDWRNETGDNALLALMQALAHSRRQREQLRAVCIEVESNLKQGALCPEDLTALRAVLADTRDQP